MKKYLSILFLLCIASAHAIIVSTPPVVPGTYVENNGSAGQVYISSGPGETGTWGPTIQALSAVPSDASVYASRTDIGVFDTNATMSSIWDFPDRTMWLCGETYGTNMVDFSLVKTNVASYANVPCVRLDGVADTIRSEVPYTSFTNGFTLRCGFYCDSANPIAESVFAYGNTSSGSLGISMSGGELLIGVRKSEVVLVRPTPAHGWNDVLLVWDPDALEVTATITNSVYPTGETFTANATSALLDDVISASSWCIGTNVIGGVSVYFDGKVSYASVVVDNHPEESFDWRFEEGSGDICYDVAGNGNNATIHADGSSIATVRSGRVDKVPYMATHGGSKVLSFVRDSSSYASTELTTDLGTDDFEFEVTFRCTADSAVSSDCNLLTQYTATLDQRSWRIDYSPADERITFSSSTNGTSSSLTTLNFPVGSSPLDTWNHLRVERVSGVLSVYTNNVLLVSSSWPYDIYAGSANVIIGGRDGGAAGSFDGDIVYVNVNNEAVYYSQNASDTWPDMSGNGNDATLVDMDILQYPAMASGTNDVAGLGILNPPDMAHNGCEYDLNIASVTNGSITYAELIQGGHDVSLVTNDYYQIEEIYTDE